MSRRAKTLSTRVWLAALTLLAFLTSCGIRKISHRNGTGGAGSQDVQPSVTPKPADTPEAISTPRSQVTGFGDEAFAACFGLDISEIPFTDIRAEEAGQFCGNLTEIDFLSGVVESKDSIDVPN